MMKKKNYIFTYSQLAGGWRCLGDDLDGLGRLDSSDDNNDRGYLLSAHFWFCLGFLK